MSYSYKKHGSKWTINEILQLQREYELLNMSLTDIAAKHERTLDAIVYKIESEGFVNNSLTKVNPNPALNIIENANIDQLEEMRSLICKRLNQLRNQKMVTRSQNK